MAVKYLIQFINLKFIGCTVEMISKKKFLSSASKGLKLLAVLNYGNNLTRIADNKKSTKNIRTEEP